MQVKGVKMTKILTRKIKKDYGSLQFFLNKHKINRQTYYTVVSGNGVSKRIADILIRNGYIKSDKELRKSA